MQPHERKAVLAAGRASFPLPAWPFLTAGPLTLVAVDEGGRVLGAAVPKITSLAGRTCGHVEWLFVRPEARGMHAGGKLVAAAVELFEREGCDEMTAAVDGFNSPSWRLFARQGFEAISFSEQVSRWGWWLPVAWVKLFHFADIGHQLWARPGQSAPRSERREVLATIAVCAGIGAVAFGWRLGFTGLPAPVAAAIAAATALLLAGGRIVLQRWMLARRNVATEFRAWESGFALAAVVAVIGGAPMLPLGGVYPRGRSWRYADVAEQLADAALVTVAFMLAIGWAALLVQATTVGPVSAVAAVIRLMSGFALLFNLLLPVFPLAVYDGRRLWDSSRWLWLACAAATLPLLPFFV